MSETKAMKCPDCQREMESGFVRFGHGGGLGVSFHKEKPSFWSGRMARRLIDALLFSPVRIAYVCRDCKLL
ncbi:MAG: PF20097 family protein, partial [Candidatus Bathyarchaeota archaeon]|nr:PF20097 family protein [Candidatus Bathyarchaeota archaeon]